MPNQRRRRRIQIRKSLENCFLTGVFMANFDQVCCIQPARPQISHILTKCTVIMERDHSHPHYTKL